MSPFLCSILSACYFLILSLIRDLMIIFSASAMGHVRTQNHSSKASSSQCNKESLSFRMDKALWKDCLYLDVVDLHIYILVIQKDLLNRIGLLLKPKHCRDYKVGIETSNNINPHANGKSLCNLTLVLRYPHLHPLPTIPSTS